MLIDDWACCMAVIKARRARAGLNFLCPTCNENSVHKRVVGVIDCVDSVSGEWCGVNTSSADRGFFFDVTDVQSDMTLRFRFNARGSRGVVLLLTRNRVFPGNHRKKFNSTFSEPKHLDSELTSDTFTRFPKSTNSVLFFFHVETVRKWVRRLMSVQTSKQPGLISTHQHTHRKIGRLSRFAILWQLLRITTTTTINDHDSCDVTTTVIMTILIDIKNRQ